MVPIASSVHLLSAVAHTDEHCGRKAALIDQLFENFTSLGLHQSAYAIATLLLNESILLV